MDSHLCDKESIVFSCLDLDLLFELPLIGSDRQSSCTLAAERKRRCISAGRRHKGSGDCDMEQHSFVNRGNCGAIKIAKVRVSINGKTSGGATIAAWMESCWWKK